MAHPTTQPHTTAAGHSTHEMKPRSRGALRKAALATMLLALPLASGQALATGITFNVTFFDIVNNTNAGFDDPVFGAARVNTFLSTLGTIDAAVGDAGVLDIDVLNSQTDGAGFLASAGPFFSGGPNGYQNGAGFTHITTGVDPFGGVADVEISYDFGFNWNSELDAPTASEYDLATITLRELTQGLGFLSLTTPAGTSAITGTNPGVYSVMDSFLERGDGTMLFGAGGAFLGSTTDLTSGDVFFDGPNARAANGGLPVQMYAPGTFDFGNSLWLVQASTLMGPSIGTGTAIRGYSAQELGILYDIGYLGRITPEPVPAPATVALFGVGLLGVGYARRRRAG